MTNIETITQLGILGGSASVALKILGPTADYLGEGLKSWTKTRGDNLARIFDSAANKLGDDINAEGGISPRVLKGVLTEGSYIDDEIMAEYFGGVLATSKMLASRDDRGAYINEILSRLSSYQVRAHYLIYSALKDLYDGSDEHLSLPKNRDDLKFFIPDSSFFESMDFNDDEMKNVQALMSHILEGLTREGLISQRWAIFSHKNKDEFFSKAQSGGVTIIPALRGAELFCWAHGKHDVNSQNFFDKDNVFEFETDLLLFKDCIPVKK